MLIPLDKTPSRYKLPRKKGIKQTAKNKYSLKLDLLSDLKFLLLSGLNFIIILNNGINT